MTTIVSIEGMCRSGLAHFLGLGRSAAVSERTQPRSRAPVARRSAIPTRAPATWAHLLQAPVPVELPVELPARPPSPPARPSAIAAQVHAAAAKARNPTGIAPPTLRAESIAAQVVAAAEHRLAKPGEVVLTAAGIRRPLKPGSVAAIVVAAGKKRRGEIA